MSKRKSLSYGDVFKEYSRFYRSIPPSIDNNLRRNNLYIFDSNLQDYDYLYGGYRLDAKLKRMQYTEFRIEGKYHHRPELFCFDIYGDTDYWWFLLFFNGLDGWDQFNVNKVIKIPIKEEIDNFMIEWRF